MREIIIEPNMVFQLYQINYKQEQERLWVYFHVQGLGCIYRGTLCSRVRCSHIRVGPYGSFLPCPGVQCFHTWNHCSKGSCSFIRDGKDLSDHTLWLLIRRNKTPGQGWAVGFIANICLASCRNSTGLKWTDPLMSQEGASRRNSCALHLSDIENKGAISGCSIIRGLSLEFGRNWTWIVRVLFTKSICSSPFFL